MTHLNITDLSKSFEGNTVALDALSLDIASGELLAILGPSGCGKTTALKLIAGMLQPTSGDIAIDGKSIVHIKPENRGTVMVFQNHLLFPHLNVADNIGFGLRMRNLPSAEITRRVTEMMELTHISGLSDRMPLQLSGGQQQRAALARALVIQPRVLLLDEPFSSLDAHLRAEMRSLVKSLHHAMKTTTVLVTHDQEEAVSLADRIALLFDGRLRQYAGPDQFFRRPADTQTAKFFGGRNFIAGKAGNSVFSSKLGNLNLLQRVRPGPGILTIRPEDIRIGTSADNQLAARVADRINHGTHVTLQLAIADEILYATVHRNDVNHIGTNNALMISLPAADLWVMTA